ncbi:MAG: SpoVR family protein [Bacteriovoracaceae bacterium]
MNRTRPISGELLALKNEIEGYAIEAGLDFFPQIFEVCDYDTINILAAQGGFPSRYPHWKFGMDYDQLSKGYAYGLQKIYEMVINTDPCYAYLLQANNWVDQKIVMAHVYGHNDFFKNNAWFSGTNRKMMDVMANHGTKIRRYIEKYGNDTVETFIDKVLSLENLLDINELFESPELKRRRAEQFQKQREEASDDGYLIDDRSQALKSFMRSKARSNKKEDPKKEEVEITAEKTQLKTRDILGYLIQHAPIEEWQADIIGILREEAYYFLPQRLTKIMNEGWASYWHSNIMTTRALDSSEIIEFADKHAGVMAMSKKQINPYKVGIELMRDIEYRWDRGMFGKEYNECTDMTEKLRWDTKLGQGRKKIFEVRKSHNDISFIDEFLTPEFCERQQLFTYKYNPRTGRFEIDSKDFQAIKQKLLSQLTNFGQPIIEVEDGNYMNRKELLLSHVHYGVDLDVNFANETLRNLYAIWRRPVNLRTKYEDKEVVFHFDGKEFKPLH